LEDALATYDVVYILIHQTEVSSAREHGSKSRKLHRRIDPPPPHTPTHQNNFISSLSIVLCHLIMNISWTGLSP